MKKNLDKNKKIVMYGAGQKSHGVYQALKMSGYEVVYGVVTSDAIAQTMFEDLKIYPISQKKEDIIVNHYQVVIASFQRYEDEIVKEIESNGIQDYYRLADMPWGINFDEYENLDKQEYENLIKKEYLENTAVYRFDDSIKAYMKQPQNKLTDPGKILFVLMIMYPRQYKIIQALKRKGYQVEVLIWINAMWLNEDRKKQYEALADKCVVCERVEEVMLYAAASNAKVMHIFSEANSTIELPQVLINCKSLFPQIVFDEYDVVTEMYRQVSKEIWEKETFCLQNTDAVCHRGTEITYLESLGYDLCPKRIHFEDYCREDSHGISPQKSRDDALHLVYTGGLVVDRAYERSYISRFLEFADICKKNNTHLHIYPASYDMAKLHQYIKKEKENEYFHLHQSVPFDQLSNEIKQYDFGVFPVRDDYKTFIDEIGDYTVAQAECSGTNKLFDFIDAGLPIIAVVPEHMCERFEMDGILIRQTMGQIDFEELIEKRNEMKRQVEVVREKYRISNQIPRLIKFYNSL